LETGAVTCWGDNSGGELGDGTTEKRSMPVQVQDLSNALQLALGAGHSCALLSDHTVWCWGRGDLGELGDGTMNSSSRPVMVQGLP
jgi:alpha-tubulin suppressor-like RCC1 family protein